VIFKHRFVSRGNSAKKEDQLILEPNQQIDSEERYKAILEFSDDGILVLNKKNRVIDTNKRLDEIIGFKKNDLVGKTIISVARLLTNRDLSLLSRNPLKRTINVKGSPREVDVFDKNGALVTIQIKYRPLKPESEISGTLVIIKNVTEQKRAERLSIGSLELYKSLMNNIGIGVFRSTPGAVGRFLEVNSAMEVITGYSEEELLQINVAELYLDHQERENIDEQVLSGTQSKSWEVRFKKKDGTEIIVREKKVAVKGNDSKTLYIEGFLEDVTESKQAESKLAVGREIAERKAAEVRLQQSEAKYSTLVEKGNDSVIIVQDNILKFANTRMIELMGFPMEEIIGRPFVDFVSPEYRDFVADNYKKRINGESAEDSYEIEILSKMCRAITVEIRASAIDYEGRPADMAVIRDITERKNAESALHMSENSLRNSMDNSPMGIRISNRKDQTLYVNRGFLEMFGYKNAEEIEENPPLKRYTTESYANFLDRMEKQKYGAPRPESVEIQIIRKDGGIRYLQLSTKEVVWNGEQQFQNIYSDITERKWAEKALRASEEKYSTLVEQNTDGIVILKNRQIVFANRTMCKISGYSPDEIIGKDFHELAAPEYRELLIEREREGLTKKVVSENDAMEIVTKDGRRIPVEAKLTAIEYQGSLAGMAIIQDITDRRQGEQLYRTLVQSSPIGVYIAQDDKFVFANQSIQKRTGYSEKELLEMSPSAIIHPEDQRNTWANVDLMLQGKRIEPYEYRIFTKNGEIKWTLEKLAPIFYQGKQAMIGITLDTTEGKQARQMYETLAASSPVGVYIRQKGKFVFANPAFQRATGFTTEELSELDPAILVHHDDRDTVRQSIIQTLKGELLKPYEFRLITKNGEPKWGLERVTSITYQGERAILGNFIDITERKQAEEEICRINDTQTVVNALLKVALEDLSLEETLKHSIDLVLSIPWLTFESRGSIFLVEDDPKVLVMKAQNGLAQQIQIACARVPFGRCLCGQAAFTREIQFTDALSERHEVGYDGISPHGHYCVPILSTGKVLGVLNIYVKEGHLRAKREEVFLNAVADAIAGVIERKQAEEKLKQAAQEWRTTFDSITDLVFIHDKDNRIVRVNKAVANVLKTTPKELVGKYCHEMMHGTNQPPDNCPHLQMMKTGKPAFIETFDPNLARHFYESASPLVNEKGEVTGSVLVARDVTQQKRMEEQLIMTDRLASIGELASGIAHELNNPLTSVIGFSELLLEDEVPANMRENLDTIHNEAQRAASIVKNLLTFGRKHAPIKQLSQVNTALENVLKMRSYEEKVNNIEIEKQLMDNLPQIMMDNFQMQQVFLNIIVNAEFEMLEKHKKGRLVVKTEEADGFIRITFADDGPGISPENLKHIFDPFFTTKEVGKGTGLGLSICHGIVTEHRGKIYAKSEKRQGSIFVVELPVTGVFE
jgi:PAS domain S-box-containing protein